MGQVRHSSIRLTEWGESAFGGQNRKNKDLEVSKKLNDKKIFSVVYRFTIVLFFLPILSAVSTLLLVSANARRILPILLT